MRAAAVFLLLTAAALAQSAGPEQLFREAVAAQQRGDDALAIRKYQEVLKLRPGTLEARANLGAALARTGRLDEAIEQYRAALALAPANSGLKLNLALAHYKKGSLREAVAQLKPLRDADPGNVQVAMLLADCYARLGEDKQVVALLAPLEASRADDLGLKWLLGSAMIRSGQSREGLRRVEAVAKGGNSAEAYLLAGQTSLKLNEFENARDFAAAAAKLNPALPGLLTLRGTVLSYLGDHAGAIQALRKAVEADDRDAAAHLALGAVLHTERDLPAARQHLERALALDATSNVARYEMARLERTEGKLEDAAKNFEQVIRDNPQWAQPHLELAALYFRLNRQQDGERERAVFEKLNETKPTR